MVHIVAGNGGFAWFTLLWPAPAVVTSFTTAYALDDPNRMVSVGSVQHPLYARRRSSQAVLMQGLGKNPMPTAFVVGNNETHTANPTSAINLGINKSLIGAGALAQNTFFAPAIPVLTFASATYTAVAGGPAAVNALDVDGAITALKTKVTLTAAEEAALRPSPATLATWYAAGAPTKTTQFAELMLFAANLFKRGFAGTVVLNAFRDDPHGAFANGTALATSTSDDNAGILNGFYAELANVYETSCGYKGAPLALADNVMVVINGDTPKNSFNNQGWADGTNQNSNFLYVRANGWIVPGWFGEVTAGSGRAFFDPATGALGGGGTAANNLAAALNGTLYAITRGNAAAVTAFDPSTYAGVRAAAPP